MAKYAHTRINIWVIITTAHLPHQICSCASFFKKKIRIFPPFARSALCVFFKSTPSYLIRRKTIVVKIHIYSPERQVIWCRRFAWMRVKWYWMRTSESAAVKWLGELVCSVRSGKLVHFVIGVRSMFALRYVDACKHQIVWMWELLAEQCVNALCNVSKHLAQSGKEIAC